MFFSCQFNFEMKKIKIKWNSWIVCIYLKTNKQLFVFFIRLSNFKVFWTFAATIIVVLIATGIIIWQRWFNKGEVFFFIRVKIHVLAKRDYIISYFLPLRKIYLSHRWIGILHSVTLVNYPFFYLSCSLFNNYCSES